MRALLKAARSTISLGSKSNTAIQKVSVVSSDSGQQQEDVGVPELRGSVRVGKSPAGPSGAWAKASAGSPERNASAASTEEKPSGMANEESAQSKAGGEDGAAPSENKPSGKASAASPEQKASAASTIPTKGMELEVSDMEDEEPPKPVPKKTVAFAQDVQEGYNSRAQDRERWLASLGGSTDGLGAINKPTLVKAAVRAPMEWEQKPQQELPGMLPDTNLLPMKELRRARLSSNSGATEEEAPAPTPATQAFVQLREPTDVFTEQLKKWNVSMKKGGDEFADGPLTGNVRVTWSFGPVR
eukprot:TRINITY_DN92343_c0_g1_i1.p1 TRINITY_DN92343_c0_g1~~TRINITY_DN92343_c0_g1_i1.p1  ORF type:complete len:300 (+),score=71.99 TRINITY_DN92343_c0_g1_i1:64-963(+)